MAQNIIKQSVAYSYIFSQPFATYIDAYPMLQNQWLIEEGEHLIAYGDHSPVVRIIQHKLNDLKYFDDTIDGEYGLFTEYALKKFQEDHAIDGNGSLNKQTIEAIIEVEQNYYLNQLTSIEEPLYYGDQSDQIVALQRALYYLGFLEDTVDGIFGPLTETALLDAQRTFGFEETPAVSEELVETITTESKIEKVDSEQDQSEKESSTQASEPIAVKKNNTNAQMEKVIEAAKSQTGVRYQWGGDTPTGFDCSGFVQYAFQQQTIAIPRTVSEIWHQTVPVDQPSIGDLVFFETYKTGPSHIGIYLGNNQFIHASESKGVTTSELSEQYWNTRYLGSRRIHLD
ncbi:C40 family peptidase [Amphibacillus sp. Q70]|uniref:C40 family peptidase n=1 Tax=Amphibacillus sp. Q70 TaxID=3453416 RepID=UPI003F836A3A